MQDSPAGSPSSPADDWGGHALGDPLFFTGGSESFPSGDRVVHGKQGEVMGPATSETRKGKGLQMKFEGNKGFVDCLLTDLSRSPPP